VETSVFEEEYTRDDIPTLVAASEGLTEGSNQLTNSVETSVAEEEYTKDDIPTLVATSEGLMEGTDKPTNATT